MVNATTALSSSWQYLNFPIIFSGTGTMPPATPLNFVPWVLISFLFNYIIRRCHFGWWSKYNYVLSAGLEAGVSPRSYTVAKAYKNLRYSWYCSDCTRYNPRVRPGRHTVHPNTSINTRIVIRGFPFSSPFFLFCPLRALECIRRIYPEVRNAKSSFLSSGGGLCRPPLVRAEIKVPWVPTSSRIQLKYHVIFFRSLSSCWSWELELVARLFLSGHYSLMLSVIAFL
ncbi:hypothetical protein BJV78DRAFT_276867 [Lactifluus subvellereus]|nr:hypothetical protein BJV78DRAFT_276867 [Lactifluus subvellereus]